MTNLKARLGQPLPIWVQRAYIIILLLFSLGLMTVWGGLTATMVTRFLMGQTEINHLAYDIGKGCGTLAWIFYVRYLVRKSIRRDPSTLQWIRNLPVITLLLTGSWVWVAITVIAGNSLVHFF